MEKLTSRQQQVLDIIRHHIGETGYPPTRADIAREMGFKSANAGAEHLKALARVSRLLRREDVRQRLRAAPDSEAIHAVLAGEPATDAA